MPHTETETDRTKDTQAKLKTSAPGDSVKEGFLEEEYLAGKEEGSGNGLGRKLEQIAQPLQRDAASARLSRGMRKTMGT